MTEDISGVGRGTIRAGEGSRTNRLPLSPELALVDADLRAEAIALLPPVSPFSFLELRPQPITYAEPRRPPNILVAGLVYLLTAVVRTCAFNAAVFVAVALLVLVVNLAA